MPRYQPYISKDFVIEGSFLRLDDKQKAWEEIDGRMRTAIRKAQKAGAVIRKTGRSQAEIDVWRPFCLNPDDIPPILTERYHPYVAEFRGEIVAAILVVEIGEKLFMLCHASTPEAKEQNIPSLLLWHIVEECTGGRFSRFDVGASYRPNLQTFFSGWRTEGYPMIMKPPELAPVLNLTPFDTAALGEESPAEWKRTVDRALEEKFQGKVFTFFPRAMYAIFTLIKSLTEEGALAQHPEVWITTTTDAHYISSCVTSAIEQSSPWTRTLTERTGAIFVIHEFGFPHPRLTELRRIATERGIPLIEDCAYGWGTTDTGNVGDYVIYSLTKAFPVQCGGYLVGRHFTHEELWKHYGCSDRGKQEYTERHLASWIALQTENTRLRQKNYAWYERLFGTSRTVFPLGEGIEPGAFLLRMENEERMQEVSAFVRTFRIECGNYWQSSAIILPVHQRLQRAHLEYIAGTVLATEREWCGVPGKR